MQDAGNVELTIEELASALRNDEVSHLDFKQKARVANGLNNADKVRMQSSFQAAFEALLQPNITQVDTDNIIQKLQIVMDYKDELLGSDFIMTQTIGNQRFEMSVDDNIATFATKVRTAYNPKWQQDAQVSVEVPVDLPQNQNPPSVQTTVTVNIAPAVVQQPEVTAPSLPPRKAQRKLPDEEAIYVSDDEDEYQDLEEVDEGIDPSQLTSLDQNAPAPQNPAQPQQPQAQVPPATSSLSDALAKYNQHGAYLNKSNTEEVANALLQAAGSNLKFADLAERQQKALNALIAKKQLNANNQNFNADLAKAAESLVEQAYYGSRDISNIALYVKNNEKNRNKIKDLFENRSQNQEYFDTIIKGALDHEANKLPGASNTMRRFLENRVGNIIQLNDWIDNQIADRPVRTSAVFSSLILIGMMFIPGGFATGLLIFAAITGTSAVIAIGTELAKTVPGKILFSLPALALDVAVELFKGLAQGVHLITGGTFPPKWMMDGLGKPFDFTYTTKLWSSPKPYVQYGVESFAKNNVDPKAKAVEGVVESLKTLYQQDQSQYNAEIVKLNTLHPGLVQDHKFRTALQNAELPTAGLTAVVPPVVAQQNAPGAPGAGQQAAAPAPQPVIPQNQNVVPVPGQQFPGGNGQPPIDPADLQQAQNLGQNINNPNPPAAHGQQPVPTVTPRTQNPGHSGRGGVA